MKELGYFKTVNAQNKIVVDTKKLNVGLNEISDHFIKLDDNKNIIYVINKICDHAGGRLIRKGNKAICPMHNWTLNLDSLNYDNSFECKKKIDYKKKSENVIEFFSDIKSLNNPFKKKSKSDKITCRWLNHACVYVEYNGIRLITDPWLFGPAFLTGWWLKESSPEESIKLLKDSDYVFISHNHPDHLHPETLSLLSKDKKIIIGDFYSKSTEKYLRSLGFNNLIILNFKKIYEISPNFQISILKSGDFRDDSGLYLNANGVEILFTVDSNYLNFHQLPQNIDLLMTAFAGGASGFPLCFDNFSFDEKIKVTKRNKLSMRNYVINYLKYTTPKYYMPYAGMFAELSSRDDFILKNNLKNGYNEIKKIVKKSNSKFIEPNNNQVIQISTNDLNIISLKENKLKREDINYYITEYKKNYKFSSQKVIDYFSKSGYSDNLILQIIPTDDTFENIVNKIIYADFKTNFFKSISSSELINEKKGYSVMQIKVRSEIFACLIENMLPWEDMSIGFQLRIKRNPNTYNSSFWYHFTNIYINKSHFRYSPYCGSCTVINQNPIWI